MKRVISSFDNKTNTSDAAISSVNLLNSDVKKLQNLVIKWNNIIQANPDDTWKLTKVAEDTGYMHAEIDKMLDHYYKVLYNSDVSID